MKKSNLRLVVLLSSICFLTACGNLLPAPTQTEPVAPKITPASPAKPRSCDAQSVADANEIITTYKKSYRESTGMEINTYLFPTPDLQSDPTMIKPIIKAIRLSALGLQLDERCLQVADCVPTEENKNEMTNFHRTCFIISYYLVGNIFGRAPSGKAIDYETGRIDTLNTPEVMCKDREPTSYLNARGKDQVPLRWVERGIWLSAPYLLANINENGLNEKNEQLYKDLIYLCRIFKESDKRQHCSIKDPEVLSRCESVEALQL